jgi:hypothetical protein
MKEIHTDLQTLKPYLYVVAGVFLGIALCMLLGKLGYLRFDTRSGTGPANNQLGTAGQAEVIDYLKDVDPTKPYIDQNGVERPALYTGEGTYVPPRPLTPEELKEIAKNAPPITASQKSVTATTTR